MQCQSDFFKLICKYNRRRSLESAVTHREVNNSLVLRECNYANDALSSASTITRFTADSLTTDVGDGIVCGYKSGDAFQPSARRIFQRRWAFVTLPVP